MMNSFTEFTSILAANYNLLAAFVVLAGIVVINRIGNFLVFLVPELRRMREENRQEDGKKKALEKYPPVMRASRNIGGITNATFFLLILPFCVTLENVNIVDIALNSILILMVYDFFYYLSHRFWFHGNGWMRRIHAVHHQARHPTYIDAYYVHPFETFIGVTLFLGTIAVLAAFTGPFHAWTAIITYLVFLNLNIINHTSVNLPHFPFRTLSWITKKHHIHHENMHKGNYATITLLYDRIFGTLD
ncbi:MAG: sterol desaturase family protein [Haliea sp.]|nr:sterol desaturase family protein [Haliea sp.]